MSTASDVSLDDGKSLRVVRPDPGDRADAIIAALGLPAVKGVLVVVGGGAAPDAALLARLTQLAGRALARAATQADVLCVDSGADDGINTLLGRALGDAAARVPLLGIAPQACIALPFDAAPPATGRAPLAPGHTHLVLAAGADWGAELGLKYELIAKIAAGKPVLMIVIGGAPAPATAEVLQAVRRKWTVLLVQGSGGAADALAAQWAANAATGDDPRVAEILADGRLAACAMGEKIGEAVDTLARQLLREFGGESVLRQAWLRFAAIDLAAKCQQQTFRRFQLWVLCLGVLAVLLSIVYSIFEAAAPAGVPHPRWLEPLRWVVIMIPITLSALMAGINRFKPGNRWVLLRSAAESIKREIYCYRLRAQGYREEATREKNLAQQVEAITHNLSRTEANTTALAPYAGPIPPPRATQGGDDGMALMSTDQYLRLRLEDQLDFYRGKTVRLERLLQRLQWLAIIAGGLGTLVAALGGVIWVALTTAVANAITAYLGTLQVESTLTTYNLTATDLENIRTWWTALQPQEQSDPTNIGTLALHTEQVLADELAGWTQMMTDSLDKLRDSQGGKVDDTADRNPDAAPLGAAGEAAAGQVPVADDAGDGAAGQAPGAVGPKG